MPDAPSNSMPGMTTPLAKHKHFMAFDFGEKRIGVAISNAPGFIHGIATLRNGFQGPDWDALDDLVREWQPDALVVGMPFNMDDTPCPIAPKVKRFGNRLAGRYHLHLYWVDERLSSVAAETLLIERGLRRPKRDKLLDQVAAEQILATLLNTRQDHLESTDDVPSRY